MRVSIRIGALTLLFALAPPVSAEPPATTPAPVTPVTPEARASEVMAAFAEKAEERLKQLAASEDPDPWLVTDMLLMQGGAEAAAAYARAAPRSDVAALPDFASGWKSDAVDKLARQSLHEGNLALQANRTADALKLFSQDPAGATGVVAARLRFGLGLALRAKEPAQAAQRFREAAQACETLGWLRRAADAWSQAARAESAAARYREASQAYEGLLALEARRGATTPSMGRAQLEIGDFWTAGGQWKRASAAYTSALAVYRALNDRVGTVAALNALGEGEILGGTPEKALGFAQEALELTSSAGPPVETARSLHVLGQAHRRQGRYDLAADAFLKAATAAHAAQDSPREAQLLYLLGRTQGDLDEYDAAARTLEAAIRLRSASGPTDAVLVARARLAYSLTNAGKLEAARAEADRAAALLTAESHPLARTLLAWAEGSVRRREGKPGPALESLTAAAAGLEAAGEFADSLLVIAQLADLHRSAKRLDEARRAADHVIQGAQRLGDPFLAAMGSLISAIVARDEGNLPRAREQALAAAAGFEKLHHTNGALGAKAFADLVK